LAIPGGGLGFTSQRPKCLRIFCVTYGSSMKEMARVGPWHLGQVRGSISYIFWISLAQFPRDPLSFFPDNLTTLQEQEKTGYDEQPHDDPFKGLLIDVCAHPPRDPYAQRDEQENPSQRHQQQHVKDACIQKSRNFDQVKQGKKQGGCRDENSCRHLLQKQI
jgi:hypothetical protein